MKEATGSLNTTVIVVIIVAALVAFFMMVIWPTIRTNMEANLGCDDAICESCPIGQTCTEVLCHAPGGDTSFNCPWRG